MQKFIECMDFMQQEIYDIYDIIFMLFIMPYYITRIIYNKYNVLYVVYMIICVAFMIIYTFMIPEIIDHILY